MSELIKAYVNKEVKDYVERVADFHDISVSKLITISLNRPSLYKLMYEEYELGKTGNSNIVQTEDINHLVFVPLKKEDSIK